MAEFAEKGFAGARVGEIAQRAGVNKQLISYYFGGKDGLYREITDRWAVAESQAEASWTERSLAEVIASYLPRDEPSRTGTRLLAWEGLTGRDDSPESTPESAREKQRERWQRSVEFIRARQQAGELASDIDPASLMLVMMAAASAPATMPHLVRGIFDADPTSEEFLDHYAEQLVRIVSRLAER